MTRPPFLHHRDAALALLNECPHIGHKAAGFCGHVSAADEPTEKQRSWLALLLKSQGLPALVVQGSAE